MFVALLFIPGWAGTATGQVNYATPYTISTLAGQSASLPPGGSIDGTGSNATFSNPIGIITDGTGNLYIADASSGKVRRTTPAGVVTTISASGNVILQMPYFLTRDGAGNLYVADTKNNRICEFSPSGTNWVARTLAGPSPGGRGSGNTSGTNDGTNSAARFNFPTGIAVDSQSNLFVADTLNATIRKITPSGTNWVVTTVAGQPGVSGTNDGTNSAALFTGPFGVALDPATNLYIVDSYAYTIRKMKPVGTNWVVSTLAGYPGQEGFVDGPNSQARFRDSLGVAVDSATNIYVADDGNNAIRILKSIGTNWVVSTLAGSLAGFADGTGSAAYFEAPGGVAVDTSGILYVADSGNNVIRRGFLSNGVPVILTNLPPFGMTNGTFGFNVTAAAGQTILVDASTNLSAWTPIWTNTVGPPTNAVGSSILPFSDPQSGADSNRFYRAHLP